MDRKEYLKFISGWIDAGYKFRGFEEEELESHQVILRHDIDFDCGLALEMAKIEHSLGVSASYFFLVTSNSYNPFTAENRKIIEEIRSLGHSISLHFDPTIYEEFERGLSFEKALFNHVFQEEIGVISFHRPSPFFKDYDKRVQGLLHTYMFNFFKKMAYYSDSGGVFRFGHPQESIEFKEGRNFHILIHPVWWLTEGQDGFKKIHNSYAKKVDQIRSHYSHNCKTFNNL